MAVDSAVAAAAAVEAERRAAVTECSYWRS